MNQYKIKVPATIGNVGPGFDCLGLALDGLYDEITVEPSTGVCLGEMTGRQAKDLPIEVDRNALTIAAHAYLTRCDPKRSSQNIGLRIHMHRNLPLSGGLGASAASSVGGAMAAALMCGHDPKSEDVLLAALDAEAIVAGRHLDNIAPCIYGGLVLIQSVDPPIIHKIPTNVDWCLFVATPHQTLDTRRSRAILPTHLYNKDWITQMSLAAGVVAAFLTNNPSLLASSFQDPFAEARRNALISNFKEVKSAVLNAGALGCTISGGGPTLFAICRTIQDAEAARKAACSIWGSDILTHTGTVQRGGATYERL